MSDQLRAGTRIGDYLAVHVGNIKEEFQSLSWLELGRDGKGVVNPIGSIDLEINEVGNITRINNANGGDVIVGKSTVSPSNIKIYGISLLYNDKKIWHEDNDGTGSGMDADKLQGVLGTSYARLDQINTFAQRMVLPSAIYEISGNASLSLNNGDISGLNSIYFQDESSGMGEGINFYRDTDLWDTVYAVSGVLYFQPGRAKGATNSGFKVWHAGNDGVGTGLDADKLQGVLGTNYVRRDIDQDLTGSYMITTPYTDGVYTNAAIEIREANNVGTGQSTNAYAPSIAFHWSGRYGKEIFMNSSGDLKWGNRIGIAYKIWHEGNDGAGTDLDAGKLAGNLPSSEAIGNSIALRAADGSLKTTECKVSTWSMKETASGNFGIYSS